MAGPGKLSIPLLLLSLLAASAAAAQAPISNVVTATATVRGPVLAVAGGYDGKLLPPDVYPNVEYRSVVSITMAAGRVEGAELVLEMTPSGFAFAGGEVSASLANATHSWQMTCAAAGSGALRCAAALPGIPAGRQEYALTIVFDESILGAQGKSFGYRLYLSLA